MTKPYLSDIKDLTSHVAHEVMKGSFRYAEVVTKDVTIRIVGKEGEVLYNPTPEVKTPADLYPEEKKEVKKPVDPFKVE